MFFNLCIVLIVKLATAIKAVVAVFLHFLTEKVALLFKVEINIREKLTTDLFFSFAIKKNMGVFFNTKYYVSLSKMM